MLPFEGYLLGSRHCVRYKREALWHERVILHRLEGDTCAILTPDGDIYAEDFAAYSRCVNVTGLQQYPVVITGDVHAFSEPLSIEDLTEKIVVARRQCIAHMIENGLPEVAATTGLSWGGDRFVLPAFRNTVEAVRRRVAPTRRLTHRVRAKTSVPIEQAEEAKIVARAGPAPAGTVTPRYLSPKLGHVWVLADTAVVKSAGARLTFGMQVELLDRSKVCGDTAVGEISVAEFALCRQVRSERVVDFFSDARSSLFEVVDQPSATAEPMDDARTLWVDEFPGVVEGAPNTRRKDFKDAVAGSRQQRFPGCKLAGRMEALHVCRSIVTSSGRPSAWLSDFCRRKKLDESDRNLHELQCLTQVLEEAGEFDQLNLGGVLCLETLTRRITCISEALSRRGRCGQLGSSGGHSCARTARQFLISRTPCRSQ